jgi:hypothetical protein
LPAFAPPASKLTFQPENRTQASQDEVTSRTSIIPSHIRLHPFHDSLATFHRSRFSKREHPVVSIIVHQHSYCSARCEFVRPYTIARYSVLSSKVPTRGTRDKTLDINALIDTKVKLAMLQRKSHPTIRCVNVDQLGTPPTFRFRTRALFCRYAQLVPKLRQCNHRHSFGTVVAFQGSRSSQNSSSSSCK